MTTTSVRTPHAFDVGRLRPTPGLAPSHDPVAPHAAVEALRVAALFDDARHEQLFSALRDFCVTIGSPLQCQVIPASVAPGGTVGRIGVPRDVVAVMREQRIVVGATMGMDRYTPVTRLWRGLQRRADVLVDLRQCTTLPGSAADHAGHQRDVLLLSQRMVDGIASRPRADSETGSVQAWSRARQVAEMVFRIAAAEQRTVLLVLPVGRGTEMQQFLRDAVERQARLHRIAPPRVVKAGLLSALLSGEQGRERWLVASVMPIADLCAAVDEAIGETGSWPVISIGRDATFYDMPSTRGDDPLPPLLLIATLLHRAGHTELARTLLQAVLLTTSAETRMREELGMPMAVPLEAFLRGVLANWGRASMALAPAVSSRSTRPSRHDVVPLRHAERERSGLAEMRDVG